MLYGMPAILTVMRPICGLTFLCDCRYCVPTDDVARLFTAAELQFFDVCNTGDSKAIL